jgi:hypothetical protein
VARISFPQAIGRIRGEPLITFAAARWPGDLDTDGRESRPESEVKKLVTRRQITASSEPRGHLRTGGNGQGHLRTDGVADASTNSPLPLRANNAGRASLRLTPADSLSRVRLPLALASRHVPPVKTNLSRRGSG